MAEEPTQQARVHLRVRGRVQGVGYRFSALEEARRLGLTGWVRNTRDGHVELMAEGAESQLRRLVAWCHVGPRGALVVDVDERWLRYSGEFDAFRITA